MITQDQLKEQLHYNHETGIFTWIISKGRLCKVGNVAGSLNKTGYINLIIDKKSYKAHRLAWLYTYGNNPTIEIDHINGIKSDNKILNLRSVSHVENMKNKPKYKNNKSGFTGVSWCKRLNKWQVDIAINGKTKYLGVFVNLSDAVKRRVDTEMALNFHTNHGR